MSKTTNENVWGYSLSRIRNRNEHRVAQLLDQELAKANDICTCRLCVEDAYALTLNALPAHYIQTGAIVLQPNITDEEILKQIHRAMLKVKTQPNHN